MNKINWTLRLKNKATLVALLAAVVAFIYQLAAIFGVTPPVAQDAVTQGGDAGRKHPRRLGYRGRPDDLGHCRQRSGYGLRRA